MQTFQRLLTVADVAFILNLSERAVYSLIRGGKLRANHIESVLRIEEADLTRFLQERGFEGTFVKEVAGDGSEVASRAYPIPPAPHPHRSMQGGRSC